LSTFDIAATLEGSESWTRTLRVPAEAMSRQFISAGLIELAPVAVQIACSIGSAGLRDELRKLGLKASGNKPELAARLAATPGAARFPSHYWTCTARGHALVQAYLDGEESKRLDAEGRACAAIDIGDLEGAALIGAKWDAGRVFPSGLGMDGTGADFRSTLLLVRLKQGQQAIDNPPGALSGLSRDERGRLVNIFLRAAVMTEDPARAPDLAELAFGSGAQPRAVMELLAAWVEGQRQLKTWSSDPFEVEITILTPPDCPYADKFQRERYSLSDCPELPMSDCNRRKYGCGCVYSGLPKD